MAGRERREPPKVDGMYTLKVDNISFNTNAEMLREEFKVYGEIGDIYIPRDFRSNEPKGFAFVRFLEKRDGEDAMRVLDGKLIDGREIKIQEAKERRPENPREAMRSRGGGGGGGRYRNDYDRRGSDRGGGGYDRYDRDRDDYRDRGDRGGGGRGYDNSYSRDRDRDYRGSDGGGYGRDSHRDRDRGGGSYRGGGGGDSYSRDAGRRDRSRD